MCREKADGAAYIVFTEATVDWNGTVFRVLEQTWALDTYRGSRVVAGLADSPLRTHSDQESIQAALMARGRAFAELKGSHTKHYTGRIMHELHGQTIIEQAYKQGRFGGRADRTVSITTLGWPIRMLMVID